MPVTNEGALVKGQLVTNFSGKVLNFMFNPTEITRSHGWNWTSLAIPGRSHPFIGGGSGTNEKHSLLFWVDGERGRADLRTPDTAVGQIPVDIIGILNDWASLVLPYDPELGNSHGAPEPVTLLMGDMLPAVRCVINSVQQTGTFFTEKMKVMKATVAVDFTVLQVVNRTSFVFLSTSPDSELLPLSGFSGIASLGGYPITADSVVDLAGGGS